MPDVGHVPGGMHITVELIAATALVHPVLQGYVLVYCMTSGAELGSRDSPVKNDCLGQAHQLCLQNP